VKRLGWAASVCQRARSPALAGCAHLLRRKRAPKIISRVKIFPLEVEPARSNRARKRDGPAGGKIFGEADIPGLFRGFHLEFLFSHPYTPAGFRTTHPPQS
jgi:hypothetical protein